MKNLTALLAVLMILTVALGLAAFMVTGPATKITNLGALKIVLGWKRFLLYLLFVVLFSLASGILTDLIL